MKSGFVALIGRPNAGKSTLLNKLVGQKVAIVSDKPQTTRNRITAVRNYPEGQVVFVDTPGVHRPMHRLNVRMVDAALEALREVDLVAAVVDASEPTGGGDRYLMDILKRVRKPKILAINKIDLLQKPQLLPVIERYNQDVGFADIIPVAALTGDNIALLESVLLSHLPEGEPIYDEDYLTDQPERFFVAELVREQVLQHTRAELPFASAVIVDRFEEPDEKGLLRLYCTIVVERQSQKPIIVGRAGTMIKAIGTAARHELERFFDARVYLDLHVKVRADWREDERMLDQLGLPQAKRRHR
ncbi:MAG: GTPase Era [Acidobacteria bacterium]|nr:GTPase Era [Acidobacteriota bacterium]